MQKNVLRIDNISELDLAKTFDCGQCFRWEPEEDGSWTGIAGSRPANMRIENGTLVIEEPEGGSRSADFWRNYLDLDTDYGALNAFLSDSEPEIMPEAISSGSGIRILRQDLWETVVHFIISQNNNIPRIKGCIERLAAVAGEPVCEFMGKTRYATPTAEKLASMTAEDLKEVRLGYRDKYLIETAKEWQTLTESEREDVGRFTGVGPKVESCIRLFGLHDMASFPIDVWVRRLMNRFYGFDEKDKSGMDKFASERFGEYAGLAQQYLFYYIRETDLG